MKTQLQSASSCQNGSTTAKRLAILCVAVTLMFALRSTETWAGSVINIDPYVGTRKIPDITGAPSDSVTVPSNGIIDIVILGDGYLAAESTTFIGDAQDWYDDYFEPGGIRPFPYFSQAFRVRAIWQPSGQRADSLNRASYYRVFIDSALTGVVGGSWFNGGTEPDKGFNDSLFQDINYLSPLNIGYYPSDLDNSVNGVQIVGPMAGIYANLYVVLLICTPVKCGPSGFAQTVTERNGTSKIRVGFGANYVHEFGHAFTYLRDEYIDVRNSTATWSNPHPDSLSVFNLSNMTYSNDRCDMLWSHLAPGGQYNPSVLSLIGNLFVGGKGDGWQNGVWHSEYKCLMNGTHANYECSFSDVDSTNLRDGKHLCFWCEEITTIRIFQRIKEFNRIGGFTGDFNADGITWFTLWDTLLRDNYYDYFDIDSVIAVKDSCYALWAGGTCPSCSSSCDLTPLPTCLPGCDIREVGNAIYVNGSSGDDGYDGTKDSPKESVAGGVAATCTPGRLVMIKGGGITYPTPACLIITDPAILIPEGCDTVIIGK